MHAPPRSGPRKNGCHNPPWPRKFSRLPRITTPLPQKCLEFDLLPRIAPRILLLVRPNPPQKNFLLPCPTPKQKRLPRASLVLITELCDNEEQLVFFFFADNLRRNQRNHEGADRKKHCKRGGVNILVMEYLIQGTIAEK